MVKNLEHKINFSTREVIEIQSSIYYKITENLGFNSLANTMKEYAQACYSLILRILTITNLKKVEILELGPGTLFFAKHLIQLLNDSNFEIEYTVIDVNESLEILCKPINIRFVKSSFDSFAKNNTKQFDFLIMNQALDMWAGTNYLMSKNYKTNVFWKLFDLKANKYISKKDLDFVVNQKTIEELFWIKFYQTPHKTLSSLKHIQIDSEKILIPYHLYRLFQKIRLGGFIQDYWNFDKSISLRTGLLASDCLKLMETFPFNKQSNIQLNYNIIASQSVLLSLMKAKETQLINWFESNIIPFGTKDVTYSPDISRVISLVEKSGFNYEIFTLKRMVEKMISKQIGESIEEGEFGTEKNIIFIERKFLTGR